MAEVELDSIDPTILKLCRFAEEGVSKAAFFFFEEQKPIEVGLFSYIVRWHVCNCVDALKDNHIRAVGIEVPAPENTNNTERTSLALSGVEVKYGGKTVKLLKAHDGLLPPAGRSDKRLSFYQYNLNFGDDEPVSDTENLVILWDIDQNGALKLLELVSPAGGSKWKPAQSRWVKSIPFPIPPEIEVRPIINQDALDVPYERNSQDQNAEEDESDEGTGTEEE